MVYDVIHPVCIDVVVLHHMDTGGRFSCVIDCIL